MLQRFCANVSRDSKQALHDPAHPFPFANLEWPRGPRKAHGLRRACGPKRKTPNVGAAGSKAFVHALASVGQQEYTTQRITAHDLRRGQIRIPSSRDSRTRTLLPPTKGAVRLTLIGQQLLASWDPRTDGDKQRSGVLRVEGELLRGLVHEEDVLLASTGEGGIVLICTAPDRSVTH